jgi:hypothetical protein
MRASVADCVRPADRWHLTTVLVLAVMACLFLLMGGAPEHAGAVSGNAGPVSITVTPTSQLQDGQVVQIHAEAPAGTVIYELKAHLCVPNGRITTNFQFGFQGQQCSNLAVGSGDVEQIVSSGEGTQSADLTFRVGEGSAHWVNDLNYDQTITCGVDQPCDLVVRAQITDDTVFFTAPLCYGAACTPESGPPPATNPPAASGAPPAAGADASSSGGGAPGSTSAEVDAAPKSAADVAAGAAKAAGVTASAATSHGTGGERELAAAAASSPSPSRLTLGWRVLIAAVAGAVAAADIARVVTRTRRRNRPLGMGTA